MLGNLRHRIGVLVVGVAEAYEVGTTVSIALFAAGSFATEGLVHTTSLSSSLTTASAGGIHGALTRSGGRTMQNRPYTPEPSLPSEALVIVLVIVVAVLAQVLV